MRRLKILPVILCGLGLLLQDAAQAQDMPQDTLQDMPKASAEGVAGRISRGNDCAVEEPAALAKRRALGSETSTQVQLGDLAITLYPRKSPDDADAVAEDPSLDQEYIVIERGGKCLQAIADSNAFIVWARPATPDGYSVADPSPLAILSSYSGGAHCCTTLYALFPDADFKMQEISLGNAEAMLTQEWVGGPPRLNFGDDSFAYWNTSYAGSPAGGVALDWSPEGYRLSESMRTEAPDQAALDKLADNMRAAVLAFGGPYVLRAATERPETKGELDPIIWSDVLDLIYRGHADLAAALFDKGWPPEVKGKREFWREFVQQMEATWIWESWQLSAVLDPEMTFAGE